MPIEIAISIETYVALKRLFNDRLVLVSEQISYMMAEKDNLVELIKTLESLTTESLLTPSTTT